ncbi:chondroitin polymerizing factor [Aphomia sociella]
MLSRYVISQMKHNSFFLVGLVLGLWIALVAVPLDSDEAACVDNTAGSVTPTDEYEPHREERPLGPAGQTSGRSVQRPRYYSTELGMKGSLLAGVLSSEAALGGRAAALNQTAALLQPALRFFITASALQQAPGLPNVVGFTDTREMLKPFHALKYLADNYLEEYDFFFLVSDASYVNARRLTELVSKLSVSQDIYMGSIAEDDSHYCTLEGGILLSNSVLRAVHGELDWCVRNSYSPRHHENLGRCVLHAAHTRCTAAVQAQQYTAAVLRPGAPPEPALADAVTAHPVDDETAIRRLHAYVARVQLERGARETTRLRAALWRAAARQPRHYRNATWPGGLRADVGLAPPAPAVRFDHLRWTTFNATHAYLPDDHRAVAALVGAQKLAVELAVREASAWATARWGGAVALVGGAWRWEPARALHYRLLLRHRAPGADSTSLRQVEVLRPLGAARLVSVPYVTESARVSLLLPLTGDGTSDAAAFLRRYAAVCLTRDRNTALLLVIVHDSNETSTHDELAPIRTAITSLMEKHRDAQIEVLETAAEVAAGSRYRREQRAATAALATALPRVPRDALVLLAVPYMEFNEEFLNRVRMNTISGEQWFAPLPFARYAQYAHPRFVDAAGEKPQVNTGRFNVNSAAVVSFYRKDYDAAWSAWTRSGGVDASAARVLAAAALRCLCAPEPALVLSPRPAPCAAAFTPAAACTRALRDDGLVRLNLGARHELARLLLETQVELAR